MHLDLLVEEPSAEAALKLLLPRIVGEGVSSRFLVFNGKRDLLIRLPGLLQGFRRTSPAGRLVILVDADQGDCRALKRNVESMAKRAGLSTRSSRDPEGRFAPSHMNPDRNRSPSFRLFRDSLREFVTLG